MEADGSSGNFCGYCNKVGHQMDQCRELGADRRVEIAIGVVAGLFLVPFAIIGYILGAVASAIWGGASKSWEYWPRWASYMKSLFRKDKP